MHSVERANDTLMRAGAHPRAGPGPGPLSGCLTRPGRAVRGGLLRSPPPQPLGAGHRHGVERQEPRQTCNETQPVSRGEPSASPPPRTPPPGLPRSFSAGRESCAPQPSQWRSRSRLSPATLSPWALGSGSRQPSCSRYFPSRARRLWAATMRKKGRLAQPPRANRITTCPPR